MRFLSDGIRKQRGVFLALAAVLAASDAMDVPGADFSAWLAVDLGVRCGVLAMAALCVDRRAFSLEEIGLARVRGDVLLIHCVLVAAVAALVAYLGATRLQGLFGPGLGALPAPMAGSLWVGLDAVVGLPLVAVSEEVVFRGMALTVLRKLGLGSAGTVLASTALFMLSYWAHSPGAILTMGALGALFMVSTLRTGSVVPAVVGHYLAMWLWP
ncbi:CPBP family intramembrane glutamic endopeptidase [Pseudodesulfovibrio sp.]|uniref:CPBP family intramembrane glutamic endopeptidase n=1 Tax=Pseudodesulfovibrio sp. TaxID=2035812 RepID=UPI00262DD774|nr:CPBP family intramembrane glutamic endopeptidase [Pseudodesulfovibrio sp.]MDD3311334.1 CPBP family intramembrane metalloprotease [Pseudodesulfovibrio sp.]